MADIPDMAPAAAWLTTQYRPDVIITDLYIGQMDSAQFIAKMQRQGGKDIHFFVLSSHNSKRMIQECYEAGAAYCMMRPVEFSILRERISRICSTRKDRGKQAMYAIEQNDLEAQVTRIMRQVGVPAHIKGYAYLRQAIIMAANDPAAMHLVTKILYPTVAKGNGTTASLVERAMRHAIDVAWHRGDLDMQNAVFGYSAKGSCGKPTNSEFIATIADSLRLNNRDMARTS